MIRMKSLLAGCVMALTLSTLSIGAFAATYETPAEAVAGITGKTVEEVVAERQTGKSYGTIAADAGKLEEFQQAMLDMQKENLSTRVAAGTITQAQADAALSAMAERHAYCNGTGIGGAHANGHGVGGGHGHGRGMGMGLHDGSCLYQ